VKPKKRLVPSKINDCTTLLIVVLDNVMNQAHLFGRYQ
jgi:hypothetical protein